MKIHAFKIALAVLIYSAFSFSYQYSENNRWLATSIPVPYEINTSGAPGGAITAIQASFDAWQDESNDFIRFSYIGTTNRGVSDDDHNVLSWGYAYGAIAYSTNYDYYPITEKDICFSSSLSWSTSTPPASGCFDVQNIATHESGHWLRLQDLYSDSDSLKTMYGYGYPEETKKRTLHTDDIQGVIYIYSKVRIPTDYAAISSGITAALTGQAVTISSGTYTENITMKSNVDLIGAGEGSTTISGTIGFNNLQNTLLSDLKVTGIITIQNISNSGVQIDDITAQDRINLTNNTNSVFVDRVTATNSCYIDMYNSDVDALLYASAIAVNSGIYAHEYSYFVGYAGDIYNKTSAAIRASYSTVVNELDDFYFCDNTESQYWYDIDSAFSSEVDATGTTIWSECPPKVHEYYGGQVDVGDCEECSYLRKPVASADNTDYNDSPVLRKSSSVDPGMAEFKEAKNILRNIARGFVENRGEKSADPKDYRNEYDTAMAKFKHLVSEYPGEKSAVFALAALADCYINLNELKAGSAYLDEIAQDAKLRPHALKLQIYNLLKGGFFADAVTLADAIAKEFPDDNTICELLIAKGIIYKYYLMDNNNAQEMFELVLSEYPDHILAEKAEVELHDIVGGEKELPPEQENVEFSVANSPNPFNPSTNIHFTLPSEGRVLVKVFDILGREITTLLDTEKPSGSHSITWNGKDAYGNEVASGVYFYQIHIAGRMLSKKMLLMR